MKTLKFIKSTKGVVRLISNYQNGVISSWSLNYSPTKQTMFWRELGLEEI